MRTRHGDRLGSTGRTRIPIQFLSGIGILVIIIPIGLRDPFVLAIKAIHHETMSTILNVCMFATTRMRVTMRHLVL
jgi:hypothetical protein